MRHGEDDGSTYVAEMFYVEESTSWMISTGWNVVEDDNEFRWRRM